MAQRFASLSMLSITALTLAPLVSAQGFGAGFHSRGHGHLDAAGANLDASTRAEVRTKLKACHDDNIEDKEAMKTCVQAVFSEYGIELPEPENRPGIAPEARAALKDCHKNNNGNPDAMKTCMQGVADQYGITLPSHARGFGFGFGRGDGDHDNDRGGFGAAVRFMDGAQLRADLQACLALSDNEEMRTCILGIHADAQN